MRIIFAVDTKVALDRAFLVAPRVVQDTPDRGAEAALGEIGHLCRWPALRQLQVFARAVRGADNLVIVADHDMRRRVAFHHPADDRIAAFQKRRRGAPRFCAVCLR